jgi:hypothetical protein
MSNPNDWILAKWQRNGYPTVLRMATAYRGMDSVPGYEHKVIVVVELRDPQPSGMPQTTEYDDLENVELAICGELEAGNDSLCVLAITGCGTRDLIFYTRNAKQAERRIEAARALVTTHIFNAVVEPDKDWELYRYFDQLIGHSESSETKTSTSA